MPLAAVLAVLGALLLAPGGVTQPSNAFAEINCEATKGTIQVQIQDLNSSSVVDQAGISVRITPDPLGGGGSRIYVDNGTNDDNSTVGVIRENSACISTGEDYTVALLDFPANYSCDILAGGSEDFRVYTTPPTEVTLYVGNCATTATATPTATATSTAGPADEIKVTASPNTLSCSGTSIVTIEVLDADGKPVPIGTQVEIESTIGEITPSSGQTTDQTAKAFVFLAAPSGQGGTAVVTAKSGSAEGSTNVTINCGATPTPTGTTAPPPTVSPGGGVITPPNTGSAGLASGANDGGLGWMAVTGISLALATSLGAIGFARSRA